MGSKKRKESQWKANTDRWADHREGMIFLDGNMDKWEVKEALHVRVEGVGAQRA